MEPDDLVCVYTVRNGLQAQLIANFLNAEGIPCRLGGAGQADFQGVLEVHILVRRVNADLAGRLIRSRLEGTDTDAEIDAWLGHQPDRHTEND